MFAVDALQWRVLMSVNVVGVCDRKTAKLGGKQPENNTIEQIFEIFFEISLSLSNENKFLMTTVLAAGVRCDYGEKKEEFLFYNVFLLRFAVSKKFHKCTKIKEESEEEKTKDTHVQTIMYKKI